MATKRPNTSEMIKTEMETRQLPKKNNPPKKEKMLSYSIMIGTEDLEQLKEYAASRGLSLNAAARMAIKKLLHNI